jgi:hypothetical protein
MGLLLFQLQKDEKFQYLLNGDSVSNGKEYIDMLSFSRDQKKCSKLRGMYADWDVLFT